MKPVPVITDPVFKKPASYSAFQQFWLKLIRDERDLPFVYLTLKISLIMLPLGLLLYVPTIGGWIWWAIAAAYLYVNNFVFKGSFGLMLHCTSHRQFFKTRYQWLNKYLPWVVGPFFGQTPETYYSHHIGMHHLENNLEDDDSTTMFYQRDSVRGFLAYFVSFFFTGLLNLVQYFDLRKQYKLRNKAAFGELIFFAVCGGLLWVNWQATLVVFWIPFLLSRLVMMLGNWAQHAFVDFEDPGNCYKNSITCINTNYNHKCWNDGYHISHHIKPSMHWTLHPNHFLTNQEAYAQNGALVFSDIHFLHIWWYLMTKNYQKMAENLVNIKGMYASEEEAIEIMKSRTKKMPKRGITMSSLQQNAAVPA